MIIIIYFITFSNIFFIIYILGNKDPKKVEMNNLQTQKIRNTTKPQIAGNRKARDFIHSKKKVLKVDEEIAKFRKTV